MARLNIELIPVLRDNYAYLLFEPETGTTGVVDPGDAAPVLAALEQRGRRLDWVLITHHHGDHTAGLLDLKRVTGCKAVGPRAEFARIEGLDCTVAEGESFALGHAVAEVFETPGHTAGHVCYYFRDSEALFAGDTLFVLGCGRLFEESPQAMWASLGKLAHLPPATRVYCGHEYTLANARFALTVDPDNAALAGRARRIEEARERGEPTVPTTIGEELATNPFLRADAAPIRQHLGLREEPAAHVFAEIRRRKDQA
ncbi:MAG: hydroxyacylglutathione hydrolase [Geminicoccaceae bacterium]|nr:MAG: hydroxyacylglutathione hydrolase [Geminicoccaceae bacterium]